LSNATSGNVEFVETPFLEGFREIGNKALPGANERRASPEARLPGADSDTRE
jgi:hypothetical protein